jgi:hypothetical protein
MHVCRAWKATALHTRSLWASIVITSPGWQKRGAGRRREGREVCGDVQQLKRALERAGSHPLDIAIDERRPDQSSKGKELTAKAIFDMISLLKSMNKLCQIHRIESIAMTTTELEGLAFPMLRSVRVNGSMCMNLQEQVYKTARNLQSVEYRVEGLSPIGGPPRTYLLLFLGCPPCNEFQSIMSPLIIH